ncbi:MAG: glycosyltransferase family 2 protein [Lachnospiraceae bacterium]|nr:glycosyltransferase family 2 protein [Lachnospiraceae bacterium]
MILYLVVPCYNEEEGLKDSAYKLREYLHSLEQNQLVKAGSKIVLVNDGSSDGTRKIMDDLHAEDPVFTTIHFSRNYGHQYAVMAGYEFAKDKCDACISIDADLQQDINAIRLFIERYNEGCDIVYGVRNTRDTDGFFKKWTSQAFYHMMNAFGCKIIPNHADYRLLSNKALQALSRYQEGTVFLRGMVPELGFTSEIVYFDVFERTAGSSKYTLKKMMTLARDGITSFSEAPVHMILYAGILLSGIGTVGLIIMAILALLHLTVGVWPMVFFGGLLTGIVLVSNGILGIYTVRSYMESKHRPRYLIDSIAHTPEKEEV